MHGRLSCTATKSHVARLDTLIFRARFRLRPETLTGGKDEETMFASIARLLQSWTRASAVRRELSHLSDRELADIGITRSDIERIVANHVHD